MTMTKRVFSVFLVIAVLLSFLLAAVACAPTGEQEEEEEEIDMQDAIDMVVEDILPNIPEVQAGDAHWCIKLDSSLPELTTIEEALGDTLRITLDEEKFFFYLDLAPGVLYEHDVKYILVDKDGNHEEYDARWWPLIDGEIPEQLVPDVPDERYLIATNIEVDEPVLGQMLFDFPRLLLFDCEGFIVVQGLMPDEKCYDCAVDDHNNRYNFFCEYAAEQVEGCSELVALGQSNAPDVLDTIDHMAAYGYDPITISIFAHGNTDGVSLGGHWVTTSQFHDTMAAHPYTTFNLLSTSCGSGGFIDALRTLDNVCVVATACRFNEGARPDCDVWHWEFGGTPYVDYNLEDTGGEWMSSLLEAMSEIAGNVGKFQAITSLAEGYDIPVIAALIWIGSLGAVGEAPEYGLDQDLDLPHRVPAVHPQLYTSWYGTGDDYWDVGL